MKWIKKFEELSPSVYRTAGRELINKGHSERGYNLIDHSFNKEHGVTNIWFADQSVGIRTAKNDNQCKPRTFSFIKSELTYGISNAYSESIISYHIEVEKYMDSYDKYGELGFNLCFYFSPTSETTKELKLNLDSDELLIFMISFHIRDNEIIPILNCDYYSTESYGSRLYGLFSDRKSATNFIKNILPKEIDIHSDEIMDLLTLADISSETTNNKVVELPKKIKVNNLFRTEIPFNISPNEDSTRYGVDRNKLYNYFFPGNDLTK
jgi:hypothetical protein